MSIDDRNMADEETKTEEKPCTKDRDVLIAILDDFSNSALSYVSAFVACMFGLYAVLTLFTGKPIIMGSVQIPLVLLSIAYWSVFIGGTYCLFNYAHFARIAHDIRIKLCLGTEYYDAEEKRTTFEKVNQDVATKTAGNAISQPMWKIFYKIKYKHVMLSVGLGYFLITLMLWVQAVLILLKVS